MWSICGFGELIKKIMQNEDKIPKTGINMFFLSWLFIDKKIGKSDNIEAYWITLPNSCDFNANPKIIKISPALTNKFFDCKISVLNIPLFKASIDPITWYANESAWVIETKKLKDNK